MTDPREYLLKFDFTEFESDVGRVSRAYTDFGSSVRDVVNSVSGDLSSLQQEASVVSSSLAGLTPQIDRSFQSTQIQLGSTVRGMDDLARHGEKIANDMTRLSGMKLGTLVDQGGGPPGQSKAAAEAEAAVATADVAQETAEVAKKQSKTVEKRMKDADEASKKQVNLLTAYVKAEINSAKGAIRGLLSHVPGGVMSGGILSGLIGAMILGYTERDRLRAEAGEVRNVFEATGESIFGGASQKATRYFANFQERAQWYFGVGRKETQGVLKSMVEAGYRSTEIMTTFNKDLGKVGENVTIASIATDKHFNQATGTSMKNIIQITTELGDSLGVATDKYVRIAFAGQRSAMGIEKFTNAVLSGASAMQQYGVDVEDVADIMGKIQRHYEDMGLSPQYAGDQAARVVGGLSRGLANLGPGMKTVLAEKMFPELAGVQALQEWEDGFKRAGRGEDNEFMLNATVALRDWATAGGTRGRAEAIKVMETQGLDNRTAATLYDLGGKLSEQNDLQKLTKEEMAKLSNAFKTEGQRVSSLEKTQKRLREAIGYIGRGLLKILVSILGVLAVGIKNIPKLIQAAIDKDVSKAASVIADVGARQSMLFSHMSAGASDIMTGGGLLKSALGGEFKSLVAPIETALSDKFATPEIDAAAIEGEINRRVQETLGEIPGTEKIRGRQAIGAGARAASRGVAEHVLGQQGQRGGGPGAPDVTAEVGNVVTTVQPAADTPPSKKERGGIVPSQKQKITNQQLTETRIYQAENVLTSSGNTMGADP